MPVSPLQKAPLGVLGAFALKVLGYNPDRFSDTLVPIADVYDQYLLTQELQRMGVVLTIAAASTSQSANLTVPNGKLWRVLSVGWAGNLNAADGPLIYDFGVSVIPPGGTSSTPFFRGDVEGSTTVKTTGFYMPRPLVLPSGWILSGFLSTTAAAPANNVVGSFSALVHEIDT